MEDANVKWLSLLLMTAFFATISTARLVDKLHVLSVSMQSPHWGLELIYVIKILIPHYINKPFNLSALADENVLRTTLSPVTALKHYA